MLCFQLKLTFTFLLDKLSQSRNKIRNFGLISELLKNIPTKIAFLILFGLLFNACQSVKKVPENEYLLLKNSVLVNSETVNKEEVKNQIYQKPNKKLLGVVPLRLHLYNLARENVDSTYNAWLNRKPKRKQFLIDLLSEKQTECLGDFFVVSGYSKLFKNIGEAPVILDTERSKRSAQRLRNYYFNKGYFNTKTSYKIDTLANKKAKIIYKVETGKPYYLNSITTKITTPVLDSLYQLTKRESLIKVGKQYSLEDLNQERNRITTSFRNRGIYHFQQSYINYVIDTVDTNQKANIEMIISDQNIRIGDSTYIKPFNLYKISEINVFTNNPYDKQTDKIIDSTTYNGINIYSSGKLRFSPKALTAPISLYINSPYADFRDQLTRRYFSNLGIFNYPTIQYVEDVSDSTGNSLIANIRLSSMKKFNFNPSFDATHSNIQTFGLEGNLNFSVRNVFGGAEILQLGLRGNIGSSKNFSNPKDVFFNILEYGADLKLTFPRILFPLKTERIITRQMIPNTVSSFGFFKQQNIGLDKENFTGSFTYNWTPFRRTRSGLRRTTMRFDLINIQYVRNINASNYFNVYTSSYNRLNNLALDNGVSTDYLNKDGNLSITDGTSKFTEDVLSGNSSIDINSEQYRVVRSIEERRKRLTEDNLILSANITYHLTNQTGTYKKNFYSIKLKAESAGGMFSLLSSLANIEKNSRGNYHILGVDYSEYVKMEVEYIKHWDLRQGQVLAFRVFGGIAIPYGNSNNIPFSRSYFAGGSNDNRGWQAYRLGPGSSGGTNDFNEANMKLSASIEYRFNLTEKFKSAFFVDTGNIWNIFDNIDDPDYKFENFDSFRSIAVGSGIGFRYDFGFALFRLDLGFKTYNPANDQDNRWFKSYRIDQSVLNIGINYPF